MALLYKVLYAYYFHLKRMKRSKKTGCFKKIYQKLSDTYSYYFWVLLNRKYPKYFKKHPVKYGLNRKKRNEKYIVSLTSFPKRIKYVHLVIETVMRGSFKPDEIILWLSKEQFPDKKLPETLNRLVDKGLTVKYCDDLRSHKKYYYSMKENPQANIILIDDDLFYPSDTLSKLVKMHKKRPQNICSMSAQIIYPSIKSLPTEWVTAENYADYSNSDYIQPFTGSGTLYPAGWFDDDLLNREKIMELAKTADDLWLKAYSIKKGVKTSKINKFRAFLVEIDNRENETLFSVNGQSGENLNNKAWENLTDYFDLSD